MVENVITSRLEIQGYENIKQIKDEITKLRQQMKELATGTEEYKATADQLVRTEYDLKQAMASQKKDNSSLVGSYNELVNQMGALKKVWRETTDEAVRADYGAQINALNTQLKQLDATTGNYQRNVGDYKNQLKQAKKELAQLTQGTAEYNAKLAECAEISHNLKEQQQLINGSSTDLGDRLDNIAKIGSGMASGFAALNAAMGLFGKDTEDVQKALLTVQQTMALVQGLEGLEGMWKACENLSRSLGLVEKKTVEATVATKANSTANATNTAALKGETLATEGAEKAQKGLNAAMKDNPIGVVVAAVTILIGLFVALKDKFKDLIANNDEATKKFNKFKEVLAGIGNVLKKYIMLPIENVMSSVKALANAFKALADKDWAGAKQALKDGWDEIAENIKNSLDVVGNYQEGAAKKEQEINEETSRKKAEQDAKDLDKQIKNLEAQKGNNVKYLKENKDLYDRYYKAKVDMYKKDTEEYDQAIRDQQAYEREFRASEIKEAEKVSDEILKTVNDKISNFSSLIDNSLKSSKTKAIENAREMLKTWSKITDLPIDFDGILKGEGKWSLQKFFDTGENGLDIKGLEKFKEALENIKKRYDSLKKSADNGNLTVGEYNEEFNRIKKQLENSFEELGAHNIDILRDRLKKEVVETLLKPIYDDTIQEIQKQDNKIKNLIDKEASEFEEVAIKNGTSLEKEIENEQKLYAIRVSAMTETNNTLKGQLKDFANALEKDAESSELYKNIKRMIENNQTALLEATNEYQKKVSEIKTRYYNNDYKMIEENLDKEIKKVENEYNKIDATNILGFKNGKVKEAYETMTEQIYQLQHKAYEDMLANLDKQLMDSNIVAEEKVKIVQDMTNLEMELNDLELEHEIQNNIKRKESWDNLVSDIQTSLNTMGETLGNFSNAYTTHIDTQLKKDKEAINSQVRLGKITEDEAKDKTKFLEDQAEKEYDKTKGIQIAQARINMIAGALGGFMQCVAQFGAPYGVILGAALATSTIAYGTAEIEKIKNTNPYSNNSGGGSSTPQVSTTSTPSIDEYSPNRVSNITGAMETEALANAITNQPVWVSVVDIDSAQKRVQVKDQETSF